MGQGLALFHGPLEKFFRFGSGPSETIGRSRREILEALSDEIQLRGESSDDYYDEEILSFAPELGLDRGPDPRSLEPSRKASTRDSIRFARIPDFGSRNPIRLGTWHSTVFWPDDQNSFETTSTDLTADYDEWDPWRTDTDVVHIEPTEVTVADEAVMELADGGEVDTIMGGLTDEDEDVIPYGRFESETYNRNKWTAVGDFYPETDPHPDGAHAAVFLRVLNRTWGGSPDQTRIGSFVYGGLWTAGACNNEYCGALQLQGDDVTADPEGSEGLQELIEFDLDEFPWGSSSHLYRVQVMEEERLHTLRWTWEHWWRAEAHDLTDDSGPPNYDPAGRIGYSSWIGEWTLEIIFGIEEPNLTNSKLAFGLGPSRSPFTGKVRFERVATNAWDY